MEINRKFWEVVRSLLPTMHRHYEEICLPAVTGQLGVAEMCELNEHIATCDSCRQFLESVAQLNVKTMPLLAGNWGWAADVAPPAGIRARFFSRLGAEESSVAINSVPSAVSEVLAVSPNKRSERAKRSVEVSSEVPLRSLSLAWRRAMAVATCIAIGIVGFYAGNRISARKAELVMHMQPPSAPISQESSPAIGSDRVNQLERRKEALESQLIELKDKLMAAQAQENKLGKKLADANNRLAALTAQSGDERQSLIQEDQRASSQVTLLRSESDKLRMQLDESRARLAAEQNNSEELDGKLKETELSLQRELDLKSAKGEIGDLVAARNLHIVDVYDANPSGKRQPSFGRVFYIEGKSLVFYAYDLDVPGQFKANVVFHVWGGKAGVKEVTHSLGILHKDDSRLERWAMTFDDPKVLAQINSVFVTAEAANKHYDEPHGKKVLYAYFGSPPNHP